MRTIRYTNQFQRDFKREKAGRSRQYGHKLDAVLTEIVRLLAADAPLPVRNRDHALSGKWSDCRDCHVRPDLVLIYRKPDPDTLELVRLGSHSELAL
jgi:mRNA interferase YafQ